MASLGAVESLLLGLESNTKKVLTEVFRAVVPNQRFGPVDPQTKSENFQAYYLSSTTASIANTSFSIPHGLGRVPYLAIQVLPLNVEGAKTVRLQVSRAADAQRLYLNSPETDAPIYLLVE